jgi:hypothetical protein
MTNTNSGTTISPCCKFQFSDGRTCRMLRTPAHPNFCVFHAREELQLLESQSLGSQISTSLQGDFLTATDINHVLRKLFIATAQDRIPLRKAAALTYLGQVLLTSLPHVKQEFPFTYKFEQWTKALDKAAPLSPPPALPNSNLAPEHHPALPDPASPDEE